MNEVEKKLSNADLIKKEYVCSFFQPIVCLGTGKIFAYEALIRGKHPETDTIISPADLFAAADAQNKCANNRLLNTFKNLVDQQPLFCL